jgi:hypothetical protein
MIGIFYQQLNWTTKIPKATSNSSPWVRSSKGEPRFACRSNTQDIIEKPKGKKKVMLNVRLQKQKTKIKIQQKGKKCIMYS